MTNFSAKNEERKLRELFLPVTKCAVATFHCAKRPKFSTRFQADLNFQIAKAQFISAKQCSIVSSLSSSFCWFTFLEITQTEGGKRTECIAHRKCGCDTVGGSD